MSARSSQLEVTLGSPGTPAPLFAVLRSAIESAGPKPHLRFGFAYATSLGAEALVRALNSAPAWADSDKEWIVSVHHGITEPAAVRTLNGLPRSRVHLHCGAPGSVSKSSLFRPPFHAKLASVSTTNKQLVAVWTGSPNLTGAALSPQALNFEAGLAVVQPPVSSTLVAIGGRLTEWWKQALESAVLVTDPVLNKYAELREQLIASNPRFYAQIDPVPLTQIEKATTLWIEAGAMSGGSRNQVEFSQDLAAFFGEPQTHRWLLTVRVKLDVFDDRSLAYKKTTFGVDIWRFSMPTETQCGFVYPGTVICIKRDPGGEPNSFIVDIGKENDSRVQGWIRNARQRGHTGVTSGSGNRRFGFF